jgi:predicted 2-oxoglutarate/Fe(II)-dependent dioxygenase YbiX
MGQAPRGSLLPGDRLPDVRLRDASGQGRTLHGHFAGHPLWLVRPASAEVTATLPPVPPGVLALCVDTDLHEGVATGWTAMRAEPRWLELFESDVIWKMDANLRIEAVGPQAQPPVSPGTVGFAPVLLIPRVFEPELCQDVIRHFLVDCQGGEASRVLVMANGEQAMELDPSVKQRRESLPRDPALEARMHERLMRRALPEVARAFNFAASRRDALKLLSYAEGAGYFRAHRDNDTPDVAHRRFALSINLNHGDYSGGAFRYPEFGEQQYAPGTGCALVFSCSLLHEVLPVERGTRYAMTTFLS